MPLLPPPLGSMLYLTTFGGLALSDDGTPVTGAASQKSRLALMAVLAVAGPAGLSRDKVMGYLWAESDSERARHALKQAVYALRKDLKRDDVFLGNATLSLNPAEITSDVGIFLDALRSGDLDRLASVYTGRFLDGVYLRDAPEFERWSADLRDRLAHDWAGAIETLAARHAAAGDHRAAVGLWRQLAAQEPLSGRVARSLMAAMADAGDIQGALQCYRVHETLVRQEVDAAPSADVRELAEQLREGRWTPPAPIVPAPPPPLPSAITAGVAAASPVEPAPISAPAAPTPAPSPAAPTGRRWRPGWKLIAGVLAFVVLTWSALNAVPSSTRPFLRTLLTRGPASIAERRVVVAPLENLTGDTTLNGLGVMASDWIALQLQEDGVEAVSSLTSEPTARIVDLIPKFLRSRDRAIALAEETGAGRVFFGSFYQNQQADSLYFVLKLEDVATRTIVPVVGPLSAPKRTGNAALGALARQAAVALAISQDTTAGGRTAGRTEPPSLEAYGLVSRAWETFFRRTSDTADVFTDLDRAIALEPAYPGPWLMKAYVLDVNNQWDAVQKIVRHVRETMATRLTSTERAALDLYDADLRGDLVRRLQVSRELMKLSPGSSEMPLLVALSESYLNHPERAIAALDQTDPDRGMNLITPLYWAWRATAFHQMGNYPAERHAADEGIRRFPDAPRAIFALVRALAVQGDVDGVKSRLAHGLPGANDPRGETRDLELFAARELRVHGREAEGKQVATALAQSLVALGPGVPRADRVRLAAAYYEAADYAAARDVYQRLLDSDPTDVDAQGHLGAIAARAGDSLSAARTGARLAAISRPYLFGRATLWRAHIAALLGHRAEAVSLLQVAIRKEGYQIADLVDLTPHQDADFSALRNDPDFLDLVGPRPTPPKAK